MNHEEKLHAVASMRRYGGSFAKALAEAWFKADLDNQRKLENAFPDLFIDYSTYPKE